MLEYAGRNKHGHSQYKCRCNCGNDVVVEGAKFTSLNTRSCGCLARETAVKTNRARATHGQSRTPEYGSWRCMIQRCENPKRKHYGGIGIRVCKRWLASFQDFLADMGLKPNPSDTIHRKRGGKGYCPSNCVWADKQTQGRHRRGVKLTEAKATAIRSLYAAGGITQRELAVKYEIDETTVSNVVTGKTWNNLPPKKPSSSVRDYSASTTSQKQVK